MYTEAQKQQIYKRWIERGRPWFNVDSSKEATPEERDIVLEMKRRENNSNNNNNNKKSKPVNEVRRFDKLLNDAADY